MSLFRVLSKAQGLFCCAVFALLLFSFPCLAEGDPILPHTDTTGAVPSDAIVIFDGKDTQMLAAQDGGPFNWRIEEGAIVVCPEKQERQQGLWTRLHFRDAQIHVEFALPKEGSTAASPANSGLYFHGLFELQIIDSTVKEMDAGNIAGAVYGISPAMADATRGPGEWQSYDIVYKAPRRNEKGEAIAPGSFSVFLNGVVVQDAAPALNHQSKYAPLFFRTTPYTDAIRESLYKTECGPLQLQDHDFPIRFRNIWIRPLDDKAFIFSTPQPEK